MKDHNRFPSSLTILELVIYFSVMQTRGIAVQTSVFYSERKKKE